MELHQTIGNEAVQGMIKNGTLQLEDNSIQPGDIYSQEVDHLIQRMERSSLSLQRVKALALGNPFEFEVEESDLGTGTKTSTETRDYVNDPTKWPDVPGKVNFKYEVSDKETSDKVGEDQGTASNPPPGKEGQRWDAGHSLGKQNGGLGDDTAWVFPQNPQVNRANFFQGTKTYKQWREPENVFHNMVKDYGEGKWKVWL
jgi:hypothetical protein